MEYIINGKKLVWDYYDYDKTSIDASRLKDNNLHIDNIWNMMIHRNEWDLKK